MRDSYRAKKQLNSIIGEPTNFVKIIPNSIIFTDSAQLTVAPYDVVDVLKTAQFNIASHYRLNLRKNMNDNCYLKRQETVQDVST